MLPMISTTITPLSGAGLGGLAWSDMTGAINLGVRILADPALPDVIKVATEIADLQTGPSGRTPNAPGVGLSDLVAPMRAYAYVLRHPWVPWVAGAGVFLVPFLLGMATMKLAK